jgi:UDP-N-acetylglucosamine 2-epimerase (non-hydrolysing)
MKNVVLVAGTRPEAIKMASVYFAVAQSKSLRPVLLSTGQHREMLDQALGAFGLTPDVDLGLMQPGQTLPDLTARAITAVSKHFERDRPDAVLVQGDTTTVLATAIAAAYAKIPVGHVEAGLRTYDFNAPWPEEMNRRLTAPLCRWSFAPTEQSRQNLLSERILAENCFVTGNTVIDSLLWMKNKLAKQSFDVGAWSSRFGLPVEFINRYLMDLPGSASSGARGSKWILVTGHRRESFGSGFESICTALRRIVDDHPDVGILYPVHLNPNVREPVFRLLGNHPRVALIEPVGYEDFVRLMDRCTFILSDSGGVQEEAPSLGKPVLVMRDTTERPEGVDAGTCRLVGTDPEVICREAAVLLTDPEEYRRRSTLANPYGDGKAAERICKILEESLCGNS